MKPVRALQVLLNVALAAGVAWAGTLTLLRPSAYHYEVLPGLLPPAAAALAAWFPRHRAVCAASIFFNTLLALGGLALGFSTLAWDFYAGAGAVLAAGLAAALIAAAALNIRQARPAFARRRNPEESE